MQWQKVTLIGVGLLGGSLGLAIKQRGLAGTVQGYVRRRESILECEQAGAVDRATSDLAEAVSGADLVVFCTPIARMRELAEKMVPVLRKGCIVTDVGSVKGSVVNQMEPLFASAEAEFIGSHPMAGAEKMGVSAARPDLFTRSLCVITPTENSSVEATRAVTDFWQALGARVLELSPELHDELTARSSHLPHLAAAVLAHGVLDPARPKHQSMLCANGFRDSTRVASGSPEMWRDISLANRRNLAGALEGFIQDLQRFQAALEEENAAFIQQFFEEARRRRENWREQTDSAQE